MHGTNRGSLDPATGSMALALETPPLSAQSLRQRLLGWPKARRARRELAHAKAAELLDRFGPAARGIAQACAAQTRSTEERRVWRMIIHRIDRQAPEGLVPEHVWM